MEGVGILILIMRMQMRMRMRMMVIIRYRDVQCMWTKSIVDIPYSPTTSRNHLDDTVQTTQENKSVEVPVVLLYSENRNYLEGYRIPSFTRVLNTYFPHPY